jgi:hypothetical protein
MTKPNDPVYGQFHGLTKREYFAAMVLQGLAASHSPSAATEKAVIYAEDLIDQLNRTSNDQGN